jgi:alpha-galactosidase
MAFCRMSWDPFQAPVQRVGRAQSVSGWLLLATLLAGPNARALTNGVALLPPMGFNSWYQYIESANEALIESIADQMATNGMKAVGYQYVNIDDVWAGSRAPDGTIQAVTDKFPSGLKALADYVHARGLQFGLYTTASATTCDYFIGSLAHEQQDANTYAQWGVDFVKIEGCSLPLSELFPDNPVWVARMEQALLQSGRPMVLSLSIGPFENWVPNYCNLPRATGDFDGSWTNILHHIDVAGSSPFASGPGIWNDPDVVDVCAEFFPTQNSTIFSMWCELAAPLLVRSVDASFTNILCNLEAIAVDQDPGGIQGRPVATNGNVQVWSRPLGAANSTVRAVALLNRGTRTASVTANWSNLGLPTGVASVRDLCAHNFAGYFTNSYSATLAPFACQFLKVASGIYPPAPPTGTNYLSDLTFMADWSAPLRPIQLDKAASLGPMSLRGTPYSKGLGVLGNTTVNYYLAGLASRFRADLDIDDSAGGFGGAIIFQVLADGVKLYDSGPLTTNSPVQSVDLDLTGRNVLTLVTIAQVTQNGAFADWAGALIIVPVAPMGFRAIAQPGQVILSWNPAPGASGYLVERSTTNDGPYSLIGSTTNTTFTDTNVVPDVYYYYLVSTINPNPGGQSTNTVQLEAVLPAVWADTTNAAPQPWNSAANWTNTTAFPNQAGAGALLGPCVAGGQTIDLNQTVTLGSLQIGPSAGASAYVLAGNGGLLTFSNGVFAASLTDLGSAMGDVINSPIFLQQCLNVSNTGPAALTLSGNISGVGSLICGGPGAVQLSGSNRFASPVSVAAGTLQLAGPWALGVTNGASIANAATLDLHGFAVGAAPLTVGGQGVGGNGAIVSSAASPQPNALQSVTLTDNASFGGVGDWDIRGTTTAFASAVLSTRGEPWSLTKTGPNRISLAAVQVDAALEDLDIQQGTLAFEGPTTSMGDPGGTLTVEPGATLELFQATNVWNKPIDLFGDGVTASVSEISGSNTLSGSVTLDGDCVVSADAGSLAFSAPVTGSGGLVKTLGGALRLGGANTYVGSTVIDAGVLSLAPTASIASSASIRIASGAMLDASALPGGMTLVAGQTLGGSGSIAGNLVIGPGAVLAPSNGFAVLTCSNSLLFAGGPAVIGLRHSPPASEQVRVLGSLTYGGTLVLTNLGTSALSTGDAFQIFTAGAYNGVFTNVVPFRPGPGLAWDTSGLGVSGIVRVVAATAAPGLNSIVAQGRSLLLGGSGGTPKGAYCVLSSSNLTLPLALWSRSTTMAFDGSGSFLVTNSIDPAAPWLFFALQLIPRPRINLPIWAGDRVVLSGSGGTVAGPFYLLASPNLSAPLSQWARIATNQFDTTGAFVISNAADPAAPVMFYRLQLP